MVEKNGELQKRLEAMKKKFSKGESAFIIGFFEEAMLEAKKEFPKDEDVPRIGGEEWFAEKVEEWFDKWFGGDE